MPANFSNLRLKYTHPGTGNIEDLVLLLNLSSINFDINNGTIGPNMTFTSELGFELKLETGDETNYSDVDELAEKIAERFSTIAGLTPIERITKFLSDEVFKSDFIQLNFQNLTENFDYQLNANEVETLPQSESFTGLYNMISPPNTVHLTSFKWRMKIKFPMVSPFIGILDDDGNLINPSPLSQSIVLYPEFDFQANFDDDEPPVESPYLEVIEMPQQESLNDELRLNYELLYNPPSSAAGQTTPIDNLTSTISGSLGRVTDEITDSLSNLQTSVANSLAAPNTTSLRSPGNPVTYDLALWALIKMGTDRLRYDHYAKFIDTVLCHDDHTSIQKEPETRNMVKHLQQSRGLPFMNVDSYRYLKIATEAFVMVNCSQNLDFTEEEIKYLQDNVPLNNGTFDSAELQNWYNQYRNPPENPDNFLPYLSVILNKLRDVNISTTPFSTAFNNYVNDVDGAERQLSECYGILRHRLENPCFIELIWSYWHEEAMQEQGMKAIMRRFQNVKGPGRIDPLANMEIDPLRPLNNLLWGYVQDEKNRLSVRRRAYEYDHHYGITLKGAATKNMRVADSRSKFIEAFHRLLNIASRFYKQADDMTVKPDGFPILNALREVHLVLSEGAHNQYGDMPSVSRAEMLMQQWMFAQPQFREVLPTRVMVAFPEPWMDRVAALNNMMGWTQTSVLHFHYLGYFGEQLLLSVRFGNWSAITDRTAAANWANFWREQIQGYIHAYQAATGVDLSADSRSTSIDAQPPSKHLYRRLMEQKRGRKIA